MTGCAFLLRAFVAVLSFAHIAKPSADFGQFGAEMGWVARSLAAGHGFSSPFFPNTGPTALMPPLFPYLLADVFKTWGTYSAKSALVILLLSSVFSALTCIPIYLGMRHVGSERTARWAGWFWAVYPFSIFYTSTQIWDYALTALLFATCFHLIQRLPGERSSAAWAGVGALCGFSALSNPCILASATVLLALALWRRRQRGRRWRIQGVAAVLTALLVVSPWLVRNQRVLHATFPIRDGFWLEFWAGNCGDTFTTNPASAHPATNSAEMAAWERLGEIGYLAQKHNLSVAIVRAHPGAFVAATLHRIVRFWTGYWSFNRAYLREEPLDVPNVFFCSALTLFAGFGLRSLWRSDRAKALPFAVLLTLFPLPYYVTHASMDYREPIEPQVVMLVALGLASLRSAAGRIRRSTALPTPAHAPRAEESEEFLVASGPSTAVGR